MSETIISSSDALDAGGFILREPLNEQPLVPSREHLLITCLDKHEICEALLELIGKAKRYIKLCSFVIQYEEVVEALISASINQKVAIFILTSLDEGNLDAGLTTEEEIEPGFNSIHFEMINALVQVGAHVRAANGNHAKFLVVDGTEGLIMSANVTEPSLRGNKRELPPNPESGFLINEPREMQPLEGLFDMIFRYGSPYSKFQTLGGQQQVIRSGNMTIKPEMSPEIEGHNILWTYNKDHYLYQQMLGMIGRAQNNIRLSTYSIVALHKLPELMVAFEKAIERKVEIQVFCRAMSHRPDHLANCFELSQMGINIYADLFNHSKGIVIDDSAEGLLFTANLDGNHGLTSGFEVGLSLSQRTPALSDLHAFLAWQIATAPFQFHSKPSRNTLYEAITWSFDQRKTLAEALSPELALHIPSSMKSAHELVDAIKKHPLYIAKDKKSIRLGEMSWGVKAMSEKQLDVTLEIKKTKSVDEYLWPYDRLTLKTTEQ